MVIAVAQAAWDWLETLEYLDYHCRFFLILEMLTCPNLTPHETMRHGRVVFQYEPLAAREMNSDWYKIKDHKVREAGRGILKKI